ncbi:hypothetical protein [Desulfosediminicola flagellatus]|uniref:hypothetical protein n=1 Tax=Desulfosediminicola flagellatus TaxID=2569541 RepID=UPI0010AC457C|nr:hypothetical protein [Desulfosediminicola flagellatus]
MSEKLSEQETRPRRKRKKKNASPLPYFLIISAVVATGFIYFQYQQKTIKTPVITEPSTLPETSVGGENTDLQNAQVYTENEVLPEKTENQQETESIDQSDFFTVIDSPEQPNPKFDSLKESALNDKLWAESQRALTDLELFYSHLDEQDYMQPTLINTPSKVYFSKLIQKVIDNPPIVSGETDDLFNILQNTAHFFRIVGKKNIFTIKAILFKEKDSFEEVLADYYILTKDAAYLAEEFSLNLDQESLYDYAGFFLTTMGGRLYLFRRDSVSRMVVSYYSILIVDEANNRGTNRHGIDIQPAITTLISELENSSAQLKLKDTYLDTLYELKEKYM